MNATIPLWQLHVYAAVGALFLWGKLAKHGREVYGLTDILARMGLNDKVRRALEPVLFVALWCVCSRWVCTARHNTASYRGGYWLDGSVFQVENAAKQVRHEGDRDESVASGRPRLPRHHERCAVDCGHRCVGHN